MASPALPFMDLNLHASDSYYAFTSPSNPTAPSLIIERPTGDVRLSESKLTGVKRVSSIGGLLGVIKLRLDKYVVIVTKSQAVGKLRGQAVYRIVSTELLPLRERPLHDNDEDTYLNLLRTFLKSAPMYFSYGLDLTNSFQRQAKIDHMLPLWKRADDRFFWNKFICADLIDFQAGSTNAAGFRSTSQQPAIDPYILPVISGVFEIRKTSIKGNNLSFVLITRRSRYRTGTRYFSRGIDEEGHVSNFNETEQAIVVGDSDSSFSSGASTADLHILSYIQTRGSVPVYWAEVNKLKYTPELQIRGVESAVGAAKKHFDEQITIYGDVYMVNLVNQKGREKRVKDAYEQMTRLLQTAHGEEVASDSKSPETVHIIESQTVQQQFDRLHYVYFDFHNETKGLKWHRAQLLLDELHEPLLRQQYFHGVYAANDRSGRVEVRSSQRSVIRTNCMDCLDRTNVVQSMLGRFALNRMLQDLQMLRKGEAAQEDAAFENLFRNIWADNADTVSKSYSGTGALKTDFTRTGNRTKAGALQDLSNSITRYVRNNFADGPRQDAFDLFTGAFLPDTSHSTGTLVFVDRRPLLVQAVPYVLLGSIFFIFIGLISHRLPEASIWPLRFLQLLFSALAGYCGNFMFTHGALYVNWPKLNTAPWAVEGYQEALTKATKDPIVGPFVKHQRGISDGRLAFLEDGKKRTE